MKKIAVLVLALFFTTPVFSQFDFNDQDAGMLQGGLGTSWINGSPYFTFRFRPEVAVGKFGMGLDLNLEFNGDGIRAEDFKTIGDYLAIIRYIRWGHKHDPLYIRVGALDYATLGYGNIMYMYNNSPSFDARTIGLSFDFDTDKFGLETVYSNFAEPGVLGVRGFFRPLKFTAIGDIPILGGLEVGASYATDLNKNAAVLGGYTDANGKFVDTLTTDRPQIVSADVGLPLFKNSIFDAKLYYAFTKILDYGQGQSYGLLFNMNFPILDIKLKFERTMNGKQYLPSYFDALYELDRFSYSNNSISSKLAKLQNADLEDDNGWYGGLLVRVLGTFDIRGSYQRLEKSPNSGLLHIGTEVAPAGMPFLFRAGYDKTDIGGETEIFKLDDRSLFFTELGYKPYPFLIVSMVYKWTFQPIYDANDAIISYEPQKRIEPRVSFVYPLDF